MLRHSNGNTRIAWGYTKLEQIGDGLKPGENQGSFEIRSLDLPGVDTVNLRGGAPVPAFHEEGPSSESEVGKKLRAITASNFVVRYAAVTKIPVPEPFEAAAVLTSLKKHLAMKTWFP